MKLVMPTADNHQKERILTEVLLETRFSGSADVSLVVGKMHSALQTDYPRFVNMNVPDFPDSIPEFSNIIKYRIFSPDDKKLYQLGSGVLSVNNLKYSSFRSFWQDVKRVLNKHKEISETRTISRIGLRYINKISIGERNPQDLFSIKINIPSKLQEIESGFNLQTLGKINNDILSTRFLTDNVFSKETIVLDFDYYSESPMDYDIETIENWAKNAQGFINSSFKECLTESYYNVLVQNG